MRLRIDIIGDSGPFSRHGLSISYRVRHGPAEYLIDCGAPIFEKAGWEGVGRLRGIVATHSHEDHRRWFTDIALFKKYLEGRGEKLRLITTEPIHDEFRKNSRGALERTLSPDSRRVIETPYEDFVDPVLVGPRARYHIVLHPIGYDTFAWRVVDAAGAVVSPDRAKVVINHRDRANRPRLLFRDPATDEWVEPESYYTFVDPAFYEAAPNPYVDPETGLTFRPFKASVWHGPTTIGVEVLAGTDRVLFSSDTVYDPGLFRALAEERRRPKLPMPRAAFARAHVVYGHINDLIERTWSRRRCEEALHAYDGAVVIHDVSGLHSVVHTEYPKVPRDRAAFLLLTHAPDRFVSEFPLALSGKTFVLDGGRLDEEVGGRRCRLDADVYVKDFDVPKVGYRDPRGPFKVIERDGMLRLARAAERADGREVLRVRLYADVQGRYLPLLTQRNRRYQIRADGAVERVTETPRGSRGVVVRSRRGQRG
jgi:ribonuclease BN (tRNA processing enzyme)